MLTNRERLILLNLLPGIGSTRLRALLDAFDDLDRVWKAGAQELQQVAGIGPGLSQQIVSLRTQDRLLRDELAVALRHHVSVVTLEDADYPQPLRTIPDPPLALYIRGSLVEADRVAVAIVGSRRASVYGLETAERLGYDLALRSITVVSGLARGIDGAAHRGALKAGGRTLAVLGNGLASVYPPEHGDLAEQIAAAGALISEYPMRMAPLGQHFPRRNRLISGLAQGVVIVEAATRSGALITCDCALEQGREVFAIPGKINTVTAQGTNQLLRDGAKLVTCVEDIIEELGCDAPSHNAQQRVLARPSPRGTARPAPAWPAVARRHSSLVPPPGGAPLAHAAVRRSRSATPPGGGTPCPLGMPTCRSPKDSPSPLPRGSTLSEDERRLLAQLSSDAPTDLDVLAANAALPTAACAAALLSLELKRAVKQLPGKRFIRC